MDMLGQPGRGDAGRTVGTHRGFSIDAVINPVPDEGGLHSAQKIAKELSRDITPYSLDQARPICWGGFFLAFIYLTKRSKKRLRQTCQALILDVYE